jgi:hypothetical protein
LWVSDFDFCALHDQFLVWHNMVFEIFASEW